MSGKKSMARI